MLTEFQGRFKGVGENISEHLEIKEKKILINPINKNSNYLKVSSLNYSNFNNNDLLLLQEIKKNIVSLDLSNSNVSDSIFSPMGQRPLQLMRSGMSSILLHSARCQCSFCLVKSCYAAGSANGHILLLPQCFAIFQAGFCTPTLPSAHCSALSVGPAFQPPPRLDQWLIPRCPNVAMTRTQ